MGGFLQADSLTFRYGGKGKEVFRNLSFSVSKGEAVLLMGASGSGKSTLAYCLAGLYPEYGGEMEGTVLAGGKPVSDYGPAGRAKVVSILFQNPDSQFCMDIVENEVLFALENINYQGNLRKRAAELLSLTGLSGKGRCKITTLSGGMKQKLALCTALATEAEALVLDEPFANLDPFSSASLSRLLGNLKRNGLTLFIVDHRADWWLPFLDRVLLMEKEGDLTAIRPEDLGSYAEEFRKRGIFLGPDWLSGFKPHKAADDAEIFVEAKDLCLYHGRKLFLSGLSFQVRKGSITALLGSSGSGKTTLLSALAGTGRSTGCLHAGGPAGLVFQNPRFQFLKTTVEEEVLFTLTGKMEDEKLKAEADALLSEFGLLELKDHSPYAISQGQQRRLALLAMLAGNRPLLLLDEPTYAQDERSTRFILKLLEKKVAEGLTVIMATHDLELAQAIADQLLLLEDGRIKQLSGSEAMAMLDKARSAV